MNKLHPEEIWLGNLQWVRGPPMKGILPIYTPFQKGGQHGIVAHGL